MERDERPDERPRDEPAGVGSPAWQEGRTGGQPGGAGGGGRWPGPDTDSDADDADDDDRGARMGQRDPGAIRAEDTEPYTGLQYVARLFKIVAMVLVVALTFEVVAAVVLEGPGALLELFLDVLNGAVLAAFLWGASDLTLLFIDVGHDVRAQRVLLGRMSWRMNAEYDLRARELGRETERPGPEPAPDAPRGLVKPPGGGL